MSYQKQNFANGEVLTAPQLNHIEDGIVDLESNSGDLFIKITEETERAKAAEQAHRSPRILRLCRGKRQSLHEIC